MENEINCPDCGYVKTAFEQEHCVYCHVCVPADFGVPAIDDEDAWTEASVLHGAGCEWVATRAHRYQEEAR